TIRPPIGFGNTPGVERSSNETHEQSKSPDHGEQYPDHGPPGGPKDDRGGSQYGQAEKMLPQVSRNRPHPSASARHGSARDIHASLKSMTTVYPLSRLGTPVALRASCGHGYAVGRQRRPPAARCEVR